MKKREVKIDGEIVVLVSALRVEEWYKAWCPACDKINWVYKGEDFSAFKCRGCETIFMEDEKSLLEIIEHYGLEITEGDKRP